MAGLMDLLNSLRGGMPGQEMPAAPPMAMPGMDPKTQMTGFAPPVQVAPSKGLRGMFGLDDQVGQSGFSRGDMGALALSQFGSTYGRNANGGNGGNQLIQTMVASKAKEKQAESKRQQLAAQMKAAGYSEQDIVAVQFAPEQAIKAIYDRAAPYTLNQGDARFGPGGKLEANNPKFAYQNDTILQEGPGGVQNMGRLDPSFENIETARNNREQSAIGWANAGANQSRANTERESAYEKKFGQAMAVADAGELKESGTAVQAYGQMGPALDEIEKLAKVTPFGGGAGIAQGWDAITIGDGLFGEGRVKDKFDRVSQLATTVVLPEARKMAPVSNTDFERLRETVGNPNTSKDAVLAAVKHMHGMGRAMEARDQAIRNWTRNYGAPSAPDQSGQGFDMAWNKYLRANYQKFGLDSNFMLKGNAGQGGGGSVIDYDAQGNRK